MFNVTIKADALAEALKPVSALVRECKVRIGDMGISVTAVDPSNVGMVDMGVHASAFESYRADEGVLGIPLDRLEEVLGMADSDDLVHMELNEETRKLHIDIDGLEYTLALIDPDSIRQEPEIPDLELPGEYEFAGEQLDRAVRAADLCSDHVTIRATGDAELVFEAQGDTDDVTQTLDEDHLASGDCNDQPGTESMFSLDYLQDMKGPIDSETDVELRVGEEMPVKFEYQLAEGDVDVTMMLAPRIQSQ